MVYTLPRNGSSGVIYCMKKPNKDIDKELPTDCSAVGKLLDDALCDLPNQLESFLDSVAEGFKKLFPSPFIEKD